MAFARSLADAREHGNARILFDSAPNQFHDQHSLTDACAAEHTGFAPTRERRKKVGYFDAGAKDLALVILMTDRRRAPMNRPAGCAGLDRPEAIDRSADRVDKPAEHLLAHWDADGSATVSDRTAAQPRSILHRHGADGMKIEVLLDFSDQQRPSFVLYHHSVIDCRQWPAGELDVDDRPPNTRDFALLILPLGFRVFWKLIHAPEPRTCWDTNTTKDECAALPNCRPEALRDVLLSADSIAQLTRPPAFNHPLFAAKFPTIRRTG